MSGYLYGDSNSAVGCVGRIAKVLIFPEKPFAFDRHWCIGSFLHGDEPLEIVSITYHRCNADPTTEDKIEIS